MMESTDRLNLPYIMGSQAQKHVTHNESLLALDAIVQLSVESRALSAPPATPFAGACYLVSADASGLWSGEDGKVAAYQDGAWRFYEPRHGWRARVLDEQTDLVWDGTGWRSPALGAARLGVNTTADSANRLAVSSTAALFTHAGADHRLTINKAGIGDTASLVFQTGYGGRAEMGLAGDDDYHVKVSADGAGWTEALVIDCATGRVTLPASAQVAAANILVNGDFGINQRGFAGGVLDGGQYGYDRWKAAAGGAQIAVSGGVASLASGAIVQVVEPSAAGLAGFASSFLTCSLENPSADVEISFGSATGTIEAGSGRRSTTLETGAGDTGNVALSVAAADGGAVSFARVKLEPGMIASAWPARSFQEELFLCQRYFQTSVPYGNDPLSYTPATSSIYEMAVNNGSVTVLRFTAPMRSNPVVTIRDADATPGKIKAFSSGAWTNGFGYTGIFGKTHKGFSLQQNNAGATAIQFDYTAEAEL